MNSNIELLDIVTLTVDLPLYNLYKDQQGTVVEIYSNGKAFEVEFTDKSGKHLECLGLRLEQITKN